jgi:hypothetical protein
VLLVLLLSASNIDASIHAPEQIVVSMRIKSVSDVILERMLGFNSHLLGRFTSSQKEYDPCGS